MSHLVLSLCSLQTLHLRIHFRGRGEVQEHLWTSTVDSLCNFEPVGSRIPPNLGDSGPLVFDIFFLHFWNSNYTYIRQLDIVSQVTEILFIFFNHFLPTLHLNNFHQAVFNLTLLCSAVPFCIRSIPWMHLIILNPGLTCKTWPCPIGFQQKALFIYFGF